LGAIQKGGKAAAAASVGTPLSALLKWVASLSLVVTTAAAIAQNRTLTAPIPDNVFLAELTWVEAREAIRGGKTTAILPTGGVEQNGPHLILGKHNHIVRYTAGRIAEQLGNALVAPVVAYVPEGDITPPSGHMRFAGTLSLPPKVFEAVLEHGARSLKAHGFRVICFIGDSGGNQTAQAAVAARLTEEWQAEGVTVLHVGDYYFGNGQVASLRRDGEHDRAIGGHAGIRDSSELMAVHPSGVRVDRMAANGGFYGEETGVSGDPTRATEMRGLRMLQLKIDAALRQIRRHASAEG